jgi:hypothetical protein
VPSSHVTMLLACLIIAVTATQTPPPAPSAATGPTSCAVSEDAAYAFTREQPVQVGGGALYVAAREQQYLDVLRGPAGQVVRYRRLGSMRGEDDRTILDRYEVSYDGLEKPVMLHLDAYHYDDELKAPRGFTCALPIGLRPPPPDPFLAHDSLVSHAIEQGGARDFAPISLDADGSSTHGVILDHFRLIARAARTAASAGTPLDPRTLQVDLRRSRTVVIAYPLQCGGRSVPAGAVDLMPAEGAAPRREGEYASGETLARLLPGMNLPPGALAATYLLDKPRPNDSVRILYPDEACGGLSEITLPLRVTAARPLKTPMPTMPPNQAPTDRPVRLQALIDFEGIIQRPVFIGGPTALKDAAIDGVRGWSAEPARINGAPVMTPVSLQVKFLPR